MTAALVAGIFTVGAVCIIEGYLLFGRAQILLNHSEQAAEHAMRAAMDAHRLLNVARGQTGQPVKYDEPASAAAGPEDLPTEPQPVAIPTVPTHEVVTVANVVRDDETGRVDDPELARIFADADNWLWDIRHDKTEA